MTQLRASSFKDALHINHQVLNRLISVHQANAHHPMLDEANARKMMIKQLQGSQKPRPSKSRARRTARKTRKLNLRLSSLTHLQQQPNTLNLPSFMVTRCVFNLLLVSGLNWIVLVDDYVCKRYPSSRIYVGRYAFSFFFPAIFAHCCYS